jgi:hypothetical protein
MQFSDGSFHSLMKMTSKLGRILTAVRKYFYPGHFIIGFMWICWGMLFMIGALA